LKAISSSSSSFATFLGFLLWMGLVPATKCTCQLWTSSGINMPSPRSSGGGCGGSGDEVTYFLLLRPCLRLCVGYVGMGVEQLEVVRSKFGREGVCGG
jgi:hypothetical protein